MGSAGRVNFRSHSPARKPLAPRDWNPECYYEVIGLFRNDHNRTGIMTPRGGKFFFWRVTKSRDGEHEGGEDGAPRIWVCVGEEECALFWSLPSPSLWKFSSLLLKTISGKQHVLTSTTLENDVEGVYPRILGLSPLWLPPPSWDFYSSIFSGSPELCPKELKSNGGQFPRWALAPPCYTGWGVSLLGDGSLKRRPNPRDLCVSVIKFFSVSAYLGNFLVPSFFFFPKYVA